MNQNKITEAQIDELMNTAEYTAATVYNKMTVVMCKLKNGFCITESSAAVDPANYDPEIGADICLQRIRSKLWELEGYALQKKLHEAIEE